MAAASVENKVYLDTYDVLHIEYHGILNKLKATRILKTIRKLSANLLEQGKDVQILADIRELKGFTPGTEQIGLEIRETIPFTRMAIVVDDGEATIAKTSETITAKSSRNKEIGYFNSESEALKWLRTK